MSFSKPSEALSAELGSRISMPIWRQAGTVLLALSAAVLAACGGGGGDTSTASSTAAASSSTATPAAGSTTGTTERATAYAAGPITGFGSIIVNGVRYDDSAAVVTDDNGGLVNRDKLKLGTMVTVDGVNVNTTQATGRALRIRMGSEIRGPVTAVNAAAGTLSVLGQTITLSSTTVFDDSLATGLGGIAVGTIVEVHALYNATNGSYTAVRVERETSATNYKLRGTVTNLNVANKTFSIGGQVISYASMANALVPSTLAEGQTVLVVLQTTQVNGQWVATALGNGVNRPDDGLGAHLRGAITVFTSTGSFEINGVKVDATNASFPDGQTGIVLGAVVEVEGGTRNGVVIATKVELDDRHASERHRIKLIGTLSALDTTAKTFKLRDITVNYSGAGVDWKDGAAADLANGKSVEVRGTLSASRTQLMATRIDFD